METMSKLAKNIIKPSLIIQATSAAICLFMVPIPWLSKFLKQTKKCVTIGHSMPLPGQQEQDHQWLAAPQRL